VQIGKHASSVFHVDEHQVVHKTQSGDRIRVLDKAAAVARWEKVSPETLPKDLSAICWGGIFASDDQFGGHAFTQNCLEVNGTRAKGHKCGAGMGAHDLPLKLRQAMQQKDVLTVKDFTDADLAKQRKYKKEGK
jgi:hypothetical protein